MMPMLNYNSIKISNFSNKLKKPVDQELEDTYGAVDIPDAEHFFLTLNSKGVYALSSRRNDMTHTIKAISINDIKPIV